MSKIEERVNNIMVQEEKVSDLRRRVKAMKGRRWSVAIIAHHLKVPEATILNLIKAHSEDD